MKKDERAYMVSTLPWELLHSLLLSAVPDCVA